MALGHQPHYPCALALPGQQPSHPQTSPVAHIFLMCQDLQGTKRRAEGQGSLNVDLSLRSDTASSHPLICILSGRVPRLVARDLITARACCPGYFVTLGPHKVMVLFGTESCCNRFCQQCVCESGSPGHHSQ